jgi:hypothetical protein
MYLFCSTLLWAFKAFLDLDYLKMTYFYSLFKPL